MHQQLLPVLAHFCTKINQRQMLLNSAQDVEITTYQFIVGQDKISLCDSVYDGSLNKLVRHAM